MLIVRYSPTATLLQTGEALVAGSLSGGQFPVP